MSEDAEGVKAVRVLVENPVWLHYDRVSWLHDTSEKVAVLLAKHLPE
jgi:hypothetical protein